jgi:manganese/iron transport system permease protein
MSLSALLDLLMQPFAYGYMARAIFISALVGAVCAFLSCYLILKGWALMGDALAHSVVPGVAIAHLLALPYAFGAFTSSLIAALGILLVRRLTILREDAVIGLVFTSFFAIGLLIISMNPISINVQSIILGNILAISDEDIVQVIAISGLALLILGLLWKNLLLVFFDETQARAVGLNPGFLRVLFFVLLSAAIVAALQTVGALLVIAMVITPGATAYLLTDRFGRMIGLAMMIGALTSAFGAYLSFFLDGATGGLIVVLQTMLFLIAYLFAPKYGRLAARSAMARAA